MGLCVPLHISLYVLKIQIKNSHFTIQIKGNKPQDMPKASPLSLRYIKCFYKHYSPSICGGLYSDHHNFESYMGKPFGRTTPFKQGKIHLNTHNQIQTLEWTYLQKNIFILVQILIYETCLEDPQIITGGGSAGESPALLPFDLASFCFELADPVLFPISPSTFECIK